MGNSDGDTNVETGFADGSRYWGSPSAEVGMSALLARLCCRPFVSWPRIPNLYKVLASHHSGVLDVVRGSAGVPGEPTPGIWSAWSRSDGIGGGSYRQILFEL